MLKQRRKEGQWIDVTHKGSGQTLRIKTIASGNTLDFTFEDDSRFFDIRRTERQAIDSNGQPKA